MVGRNKDYFCCFGSESTPGSSFTRALRNLTLITSPSGIPFESIKWRFSEKEAIAFSKQGLVPVIIDPNQNEKVVNNRFASIAVSLRRLEFTATNHN